MNASANLAAIIAVELSKLSKKASHDCRHSSKGTSYGKQMELTKGQNLAAATARRYKTNGAPYRSPLLEDTDVLPP